MLISTSANPALLSHYLKSQTAGSEPAPAPIAAAEPPTAALVAAPSATDAVRLSGGGQAQASPGVYAEIWKDGQKVALVDRTGSVTPLAGFVPPTVGVGGGGVEVAARRAAQLATAIGGEIRSLGTVMTPRAMTMRARLEASYAV